MQIHWRRTVRNGTRTIGALGMLLLGGVAACDQVASPDLRPAENAAEGTGGIGGIGGTVLNLGGAPVPGASVSTANGAEAVTDAAGRFRISGLAATDRLPVTVSAPGYDATTKIYRVRAGVELRRPIRIQPLAPPVVINAGAGGTVPFQGGGEVVIPANAFAGVAPGEPVTIRATYVDPSNPEQFSTASGDFTGRTFGGESVVLESFGMNSIEATGAQGQPVDLAPGQQAVIRFPLRGGTAEPTRPVWTFDTQTGTWVEEGRATVTPSSINVPVSTLAPRRNLDSPFQPICIEVQVLRTDKVTPWVNEFVDVQAVSYAGAGSDWTDANGLVQFQVLSSSQLLVKAGTASQLVTTPASGTTGCPRVATLVF
jgi:hypothetical protein